MSMEDCLWAVQAERQHEQKRQDLTIHYKDMLAFFWLASLSQKTKKEVEPILDQYHTVDRIAKEQNPIHPKIDERVAYAGLALDAHDCISHHPWLKVLYGLQMPSLTSYNRILTQSVRGYYDLWIKKRNEYYRR